jgi:hypothetical protein
LWFSHFQKLWLSSINKKKWILLWYFHQWVGGWTVQSDNKAKLGSIATAIASWNWAWQYEIYWWNIRKPSIYMYLSCGYLKNSRYFSKIFTSNYFFISILKNSPQMFTYFSKLKNSSQILTQNILK